MLKRSAIGSGCVDENWDGIRGNYQGELAADFWVSQDSVSRHEAGITDLTASELPRVPEVLKVPVAYFFEPFSYSSAQAVTEMLHGPGRRSEILSEAELAELRLPVTEDTPQQAAAKNESEE